MQKILFTEFAELKQGDGKGPEFHAGKAYWLTADQAVRWKAEGVAEDAPADMAAENEEQPEPLRPANVRLVRNGRYRWDVVGPDGRPFNAEPLASGEAEKLRQAVLAGAVKLPAISVVVAPASEPQPITLREIGEGDDRRLYVAEPWPAATRIAAVVLADLRAAGHIALDGERLTVTVANGHASYELASLEGDMLTGGLVESEYAPPPAE